MGEKVRSETNIVKKLTVGSGDMSFSMSGATVPRAVKIALANVDTAAGLFAFLNPEIGPIVVTRVVVDATTKATGVCTVSIGSTAVSAVTLSANLLTALDVGTAAITADNLGTPGASGKQIQKVAAGAWVTGSTASGASAGLIANVYIEYIKL